MKKSSPLPVVFIVLPGILGITSLVLYYTGMEFAWIMAAASILCLVLFLAVVFVMGRFLGMFLFPAILLAAIATIIISFFTGPWYIVLLFNLMVVYTLVFLTPLILSTIQNIRQTDKA